MKKLHCNLLQPKRIWRRRRRRRAVILQLKRRRKRKNRVKPKIRRRRRMEDLFRIPLKILANQLILKN
jgi:hypothetical protein